MNNRPLFTIFTATFNRAHTLHRVFDSLQDQTLQDFEWLIVDDGSTDRTAETVAAWKKTAPFTIRYIRQEHTGKHIAHNRALKEARGQFFAIMDSDDALLPHALERMHWHWNSIPEAERSQFWAVAGLACNEDSQIVGDQFPSSPFDTSFRDLRYVHRNHGEKFFVSPTAILRNYPFPEIAGTQFVPEVVVWFEIAKTYKHRSVNEVCRVYFCDRASANDRLSNRKNITTTARGRHYYYLWLLNNDMEYFSKSPEPFMKAALMLPAASYYSRQSWQQTWAALDRISAKCLVVSMLPLSLMLCILYILRRPRKV
jgi:glycosyltransferase involved in cell wall biosynthesis